MDPWTKTDWPEDRTRTNKILKISDRIRTKKNLKSGPNYLEPDQDQLKFENLGPDQNQDQQKFENLGKSWPGRSRTWWPVDSFSHLYRVYYDL